MSYFEKTTTNLRVFNKNLLFIQKKEALPGGATLLIMGNIWKPLLGESIVAILDLSISGIDNRAIVFNIERVMVEYVDDGYLNVSG